MTNLHLPHAQFFQYSNWGEGDWEQGNKTYIVYFQENYLFAFEKSCQFLRHKNNIIFVYFSWGIVFVKIGKGGQFHVFSLNCAEAL